MRASICRAAAAAALLPALSAQDPTVTPDNIRLENGQSVEVEVSTGFSGQTIEAVCFDSETLSVTPESAVTNGAGVACFTVTCQAADTTSDYGVFRVGNSDNQGRLDANCINSPLVFINEISYDDTGTDDREFIELYNRSSTSVHIGGYHLRARDAAGVDSLQRIPTSTFIPAGGYFVIGSASVPNVDLVVGTSNLFENDNESITLFSERTIAPPDTVEGTLRFRVAWTLEDTVIYEASKGVWKAKLAEGEGIWGELISVDGREMSWSRVWDGRDGNNNGSDFALMPATPGTSNDLTGSLPYSEDLDVLAPGVAVPGWLGSFANPEVIDPTVASAANPTALPSSPQGGNAAVFWAIAGGGNSSVHLTELIGGSAFEAYVYLESSALPPGEFETWSVGFGTTGSSFDTSGTSPTENTGVSWTFERTSAGATLFLIDHNDGGTAGSAVTPPTTLGSIPITGANDGWQRLRLEVDRYSALGSLGGTLGMADGTSIQGSIGVNFSARSVYVGYNESITAAASRRPFTADRIRIDWSTSLVHKYGTATATSSGTPEISSDGPPTIGNANYAIDLSGLVPSQSTTLVMGTARISSPLAGGLPGALNLVGGTVVSTPLAVPGSGSTSFAVPVPASLALLGTSCFWQVHDPDPLSAPPGLFGVSMGLESRFGQ